MECTVVNAIASADRYGKKLEHRKRQGICLNSNIILQVGPLESMCKKKNGAKNIFKKHDILKSLYNLHRPYYRQIGYPHNERGVGVIDIVLGHNVN